jgi:hypothetical protein
MALQFLLKKMLQRNGLQPLSDEDINVLLIV